MIIMPNVIGHQSCNTHIEYDYTMSETHASKQIISLLDQSKSHALVELHLHIDQYQLHVTANVEVDRREQSVTDPRHEGDHSHRVWLIPPNVI